MAERNHSNSCFPLFNRRRKLSLLSAVWGYAHYAEDTRSPSFPSANRSSRVPADHPDRNAFITPLYLVSTRKIKRESGEPWTTESDATKTRSSIGSDQREAVYGRRATHGEGGRDRSFAGEATAGGGGQGAQGGKSPPPASGARRSATAVVVPPSPGSSSVKPDSFDYLTIEVRTEH